MLLCFKVLPKVFVISLGLPRTVVWAGTAQQGRGEQLPREELGEGSGNGGVKESHRKPSPWHFLTLG